MPEFAIVLAIMGTVLASLWGIVSIVRENIKRQDMAEQMVVMVQNIRDLYANRVRLVTPTNATDAASITHYLISQNALLPEQIRNRSAAVLVADHPWGATGASGATIAGGGILIDGSTNNARFFRIRLRGLKYSSCVALADKLTGAGMPAGLTSVVINGGTAQTTFPMSPDVASSQCDNAPVGNQNTMDFVYTLRHQTTN